MRPKQKPVVNRGPEKEYISACCSLPASKPRCGAKTPTKNPETGKMKDQVKGLGHFRCSGCRKVCKVTPRKPEPLVSILQNSLKKAMDTFPTLLEPVALKENV